MYKCPTCGAGLVFDPKSQNLLCLSCRNKYDPENVENERNMKLDQAKEITDFSDQSNNYEAVSYKCSHCGAELITTDETITTFCSFCRTGTMLDRKVVEKRKPDYIIPFSITKEECEQIYLKKIKSAFFAPKSMLDSQEVKKIRGIYMPYWIYSFEKHGLVKSTGEKYSHRSGDYVYYDKFSLDTVIDASCSGITHDAASDFSDNLSEAIAPYSVKNKKIFSPAYLSGFYADNEDVNEEIYSQESNEIANEDISNKLSKKPEYRKYNSKPYVEMKKGNVDLALFPVYFLATKNKTGDRISYAVINGQTGEIAADIPIDAKKMFTMSLLMAIPIFLVLNSLFTFNMPTMAILSILFNVISWCILSRQSRKIEKKEKNLDDRGVQFKKNKTSNGQPPKIEKNLNIKTKTLALFIIVFSAFLCYPLLSKIGISFMTFLRLIGFAAIIYLIISLISNKTKNSESITSSKPIFGLLITLLVFCVHPASDIYYYIAAIVSIILAILSFYDIISENNLLTTRKLPTLGKRGGDENA